MSRDASSPTRAPAQAERRADRGTPRRGGRGTGSGNGRRSLGHTAKVLEAVRFAAVKHRDQRRKGAIAGPYINHPIAVAEQLANAGMEHDCDLLVAALLHDVIEDTDTTPEELQRQFGRRVTDIVLEVTDDKSLHWLERKKTLIDTIGEKSRSAQLVKLSDLIANVSDLIHEPPHWEAQRKRNYLLWAEAVVKGMRGVQPQLERRFRQVLKQARASLD